MNGSGTRGLRKLSIGSDLGLMQTGGVVEHELRTEVLVVGGGIGGLATAFALRIAGHEVRVLEQAAQFGEVGAGLQMAPNATRILAEWGLLDQVIAVGVEPKRLVMKDAITGDVLTVLDLGNGFQERYGAPYVVVHRSDLHQILLDACGAAGVALETQRRVRTVRSTSDDALTTCEDGMVYSSAAVLGLDGLMSTLRADIVDDEPIDSGFVAYRGAVPADSVEHEIGMDEVVVWIGPDCHLVQYPLRRGEIVNQVAVFGSPAFARGERDWGGPEELDGAFARCCEPVRIALGSLWRDRHWPMYDRLPVDTWVAGRLALLGDAAHPMLQYLAQGACQAIEDAHAVAAQAVAAQAVAAQARGSARAAGADRPLGVDWPAILLATQQERAPRTAQVQRNARTWGEIWHVDGTARLIRNELLTNREPADYTHIDWLYAAR